MKFLWIIAIGLGLTAPSWADRGDAPGGPGTMGAWSRPDKQGLLATMTTKAWATIAGGILTEVYYPTVDRAQTRDTQIILALPNGSILEERKDFTHSVQRVPKTLAYHVSSTNTQNQVRIEKDIYLDPVRSSVVINYRIGFGGAQPAKLYVLHNPAAENSHGGDGIRINSANSEMLVMQTDRRGDEPDLFKTRVLQLIALNVPSTGGSAGFEGVNDPWTQLTKTGKLNQTFDAATNGNVAGALMVEPTLAAGYSAREQVWVFRVAISFGADNAGGDLSPLRKISSLSLGARPEDSLMVQKAEWSQYLNRLSPLAQSQEAHVLLIKGLEDKMFRGAIVAAPSLPSLPDSVEAFETDYESARLRRGDANGGYHRFWPRDAVQMALGLMAVEDHETPVRVAEYLRRVQFARGFSTTQVGTFPQNTWVDGQTSWGGFQIDQTGWPIILVERLLEVGAVSYPEYRNMVRAAADALVRLGPWTGQDRWEENKGLSPNSIAVACEALLHASWMEQKLDPARSQLYADTCNKWRGLIWDWTYVTEGPQGTGYFERIEIGDKKIDPNDDYTIFIHNNPVGGSIYPENEILDGGFVQWMISSLLPASDPRFGMALAVYDRVARGPAANGGKGFLRYNHDGYGLHNQGGTWPLLSAERVLAGMTRGEDVVSHVKVFRDSITPGTGIICEQKGVSACPLGWAQAEALILSRSMIEQKSFYTPRRWLRSQP